MLSGGVAKSAFGAAGVTVPLGALDSTGTSIGAGLSGIGSGDGSALVVVLLADLLTTTVSTLVVVVVVVVVVTVPSAVFSSTVVVLVSPSAFFFFSYSSKSRSIKVSSDVGKNFFSSLMRKTRISCRLVWFSSWLTQF